MNLDDNFGKNDAFDAFNTPGASGTKTGLAMIVIAIVACLLLVFQVEFPSYLPQATTAGMAVFL